MLQSELAHCRTRGKGLPCPSRVWHLGTESEAYILKLWKGTALIYHLCKGISKRSFFFAFAIKWEFFQMALPDDILYHWCPAHLASGLTLTLTVFVTKPSAGQWGVGGSAPSLEGKLYVPLGAVRQLGCYPKIVDPAPCWHH